MIFKQAKTFGEVDGLVSMLVAACEDSGMNETLEILLSQPDDRRKAMVHKLLEHFDEKGAPQVLREAFVCLLDDQVAELAYVAIHNCPRKAR